MRLNLLLPGRLVPRWESAFLDIWPSDAGWVFHWRLLKKVTGLCHDMQPVEVDSQKIFIVII